MPASLPYCHHTGATRRSPSEMSAPSRSCACITCPTRRDTRARSATGHSRRACWSPLASTRRTHWLSIRASSTTCSGCTPSMTRWASGGWGAVPGRASCEIGLRRHRRRDLRGWKNGCGGWNSRPASMSLGAGAGGLSRALGSGFAGVAVGLKAGGPRVWVGRWDKGWEGA